MKYLEWFRTFKAIFEAGTLLGASQTLFISESGASLHLDSLETFAGFRLFNRSANKMIPTERGKIFYNLILDPIKKLETAEQHLHHHSQFEKGCYLI